MSKALAVIIFTIPTVAYLANISQIASTILTFFKGQEKPTKIDDAPRFLYAFRVKYSILPRANGNTYYDHSTAVLTMQMDRGLEFTVAAVEGVSGTDVSLPDGSTLMKAYKRGDSFSIGLTRDIDVPIYLNSFLKSLHKADHDVLALMEQQGVDMFGNRILPDNAKYLYDMNCVSKKEGWDTSFEAFWYRSLHVSISFTNPQYDVNCSMGSYPVFNDQKQ